MVLHAYPNVAEIATIITANICPAFPVHPGQFDELHIVTHFQASKLTHILQKGNQAGLKQEAKVMLIK